MYLLDTLDVLCAYQVSGNTSRHLTTLIKVSIYMLYVMCIVYDVAQRLIELLPI